MNQKVIIAVIVIVLLISGGAYWLMNSQPSASPSGNEPESANAQQSLRDIIGANRPVKCEFKDESGAEGTVYVGNGKVRGDFTTTSGEQMMRAHMIARDDKSYMWVDGMGTGFMSSMMINDTNDASADKQAVNFDADKELDYRCSAWSVDASLFELPAGIKFNDINSMMPVPANLNTNTGASAGTSAPDCSVCDSAPAEAKAQCRAALGC